MASQHDGPASPLFEPVLFRGTTSFSALATTAVSSGFKSSLRAAATGPCTGWGIPFQVRRPLVASGEPATVELEPLRA